MNLLRVTPTGIVWPYTLNQLREDEPSVLFPPNPTEEDLNFFNVYSPVSTTPPICETPSTHRVVEVTPELVDDVWTQQWELVPLTPEEQEEYLQANIPPPNWNEFKRIMFNDSRIKSALSSALVIEPLAILSLPVAFKTAESGLGYGEFIMCWELIKNTNVLDNNLLDFIQQEAITLNLPTEIINIFSNE